MINQLKFNNSKGARISLSSKYTNSSLFIRLAKKTLKHRSDWNNSIIVLPELYDSSNSVMIENLIIFSMRKYK